MSYDNILVTRDEPQQSMASLNKRLGDARSAGVTITAIADETGINHSSLSNLVNHGAANLTPQTMEKLGNWLDSYEEKRGIVNAALANPGQAMSIPDHHHTGPITISPNQPVIPTRSHQQTGQAPLVTKKSSLEIFATKDYTSAIGFCHDIVESHSIGVVVGVPGTGKTTVARTICEQLPKCLYIEAWKSMRLGDLLDEIGIGLGRQLQGTTTYKLRELIRSLRGSGYKLVVDEAENLKNHQVEKLDVLRKLQDNTGIL